MKITIDVPDKIYDGLRETYDGLVDHSEYPTLESLCAYLLKVGAQHYTLSLIHSFAKALDEKKSEVEGTSQ
tara:strand:+ start:622 stop:834 length:213 start_codon:yes stop_codon:yes gene_type:complete